MHINGDIYPGTVVSRTPQSITVDYDSYQCLDVAGKTYGDRYSEAEGDLVCEQDKDYGQKKFTKRSCGAYAASGSKYLWLSPGRSFRSDPHF